MYTLKNSFNIEGLSINEIAEYIYENVSQVINNKKSYETPNVLSIKRSVGRTVKYIDDIDTEYSEKNNLGIKFVDIKEETKQFFVTDPFSAFKIKWA